MSDYDAAFAAALKPAAATDPYAGAFQAATGAVGKPAPRAPMDDIGSDRTGIIDAALIGAGRTFDRLGAGLKQGYLEAKSRLESPSVTSLVTGRSPTQVELDKLAADQAEKARLMAPLEKDRPIATAIGSSLPMLAVPVGGAGAGAMGLMGRAALAGAVPEALSYGSLEDRAKGAALAGVGGAAGAGLGYLAGRGLQAIGRGIQADPATQAAANTLERFNVPVRPDQATGSRTLQNVNAALDNLPFTAGAQQRFRVGQQEALNRAVGQQIGVTAERLDDPTRIAARQAIGQQFTNLSNRNTVSQPAAVNMLGQLGTVQNEATRFGTQDTARVVNNAIDEVLAKIGPNGTMEGQAYRQLDSRLGQIARNNRSGDVGHYVGQVRDALRGAMDASVSPADQQAWQLARQQYANLANISKAVDETGNVSARKLYSTLRNASRDVTKTGAIRGDLGEIATAARTVLPDMVPNSGTAQRLMWQGLLSGGGFGAGYLASGGDLEKAGAGAALGLGLPMLARSAVNNPALIGAATGPLFRAPGAAPIGGLLGATAGYAAPSLLWPATQP